MSRTSITKATRCKTLLALSALTVGLAAAGTPAQATTCSTSSVGVTNSLGSASSAQTSACAPAYGWPTTIDTGRKVG